MFPLLATAVRTTFTVDASKHFVIVTSQEQRRTKCASVGNTETYGISAGFFCFSPHLMFFPFFFFNLTSFVRINLQSLYLRAAPVQKNKFCQKKTKNRQIPKFCPEAQLKCRQIPKFFVKNHLKKTSRYPPHHVLPSPGPHPPWAGVPTRNPGLWTNGTVAASRRTARGFLCRTVLVIAALLAYLLRQPAGRCYRSCWSLWQYFFISSSSSSPNGGRVCCRYHFHKPPLFR